MRKMGIVLSAALILGGIACKKEEEAPAAKPKATDPKATDPKGTTPPKTEPPKAEPPKALTAEDKAKWYQDCWTAMTKDWAKFETCYDDSVTSHMANGMSLSGKQQVLGAHKAWTAAFPDLNGQPQFVFVNGNTVASVAFVSGTHSAPLKMGDMPEIPATNKKVGYLMFHVAEMNDQGKAVKEWGFWDSGTLMSQLGLSPMPGRPVMEKGLVDAPVVVIAKNDETEKKNLEAYKAGDEAFNKHETTWIEANFADDATWWEASMPKDMTKKEMVAGLKGFFKGFSDLKITDTNAWAAGDYVIGTGTMTGTNDGDMPMMKMKKTGKSIKLPYVEIFKFEGGKVKAGWLFYDGGAFAMQLGLVPPPGAPGADQKAPAQKGK